MSINMSNVKAITLGGQNVKKIEDTNGNVLWKLSIDNASIITFYSYTVTVKTVYSRYLTIEQLTNKVPATMNSSEAMKLVILDSQEIQNIQNKSYNQDIILGHTVSEWQNSPDSYFLCYVLNNELYMIGNSQNPAENNTLLGTTNDLTYARHYYPFDNGNYKYVNTVNNSSTGTNVVRWGTNNAYYFINSTTSVGTRTRFTFTEIDPTVSPYIYYGKQAITSLSVSGYNTAFPLNGTFTFGGNAIVTYTDGTTKDVTEECTISGYNLSNGGKQTVNVKYLEGGLEVSTTYQITVGTEHTGKYNLAIPYTSSTSTVPRLTASSSSPYYTSHVVLPSTYDIQQKIQTEKGISGVSIKSVKYYQRYHGAYVTNSSYELNLRTSYDDSTGSQVSSLPGIAVGDLNANKTEYMYGSIEVKTYLYASSERTLYWYYTAYYPSTTIHYKCTSTSTTSGVGLSSSDSSKTTKIEIEYLYYT